MHRLRVNKAVHPSCVFRSACIRCAQNAPLYAVPLRFVEVTHGLPETTVSAPFSASTSIALPFNSSGGECTFVRCPGGPQFICASGNIAAVELQCFIAATKLSPGVESRAIIRRAPSHLKLYWLVVGFAKHDTRLHQPRDQHVLTHGSRSHGRVCFTYTHRDY